MALDECINQAYESLFSRGGWITLDVLVEAALAIGGAQQELERIAHEKAVRNEKRELRRRAKRRLAMGEDDETHESIIPGQQRLFEVLPGVKAPAMVALPEAGAASTTTSPTGQPPTRIWASTTRSCARTSTRLSPSTVIASPSASSWPRTGTAWTRPRSKP